MLKYFVVIKFNNVEMLKTMLKVLKVKIARVRVRVSCARARANETII